MRTLDDVDWERWRPDVRATLLFVVRDGRILLIRKKRGLGAGKINGPGGKLDPREAPLAGAIREVEEEIGVTPTGVEEDRLDLVPGDHDGRIPPTRGIAPNDPHR